ncbi:uncharacterized protein A4U43_C06F150 [Asparagus officinalis]|uniref:Uncharacterized protein n=1 Tax=Asparagus officinalis TaxID=4686 RepID=A0A5P1EMD5_ASPOF|nr:uncharacterized protein A4U43_C06F150 [Asparagus officinalis]
MVSRHCRGPVINLGAVSRKEYGITGGRSLNERRKKKERVLGNVRTYTLDMTKGIDNIGGGKLEWEMEMQLVVGDALGVREVCRSRSVGSSRQGRVKQSQNSAAEKGNRNRLWCFRSPVGVGAILSKKAGRLRSIKGQGAERTIRSHVSQYVDSSTSMNTQFKVKSGFKPSVPRIGRKHVSGVLAEVLFDI